MVKKAGRAISHVIAMVSTGKKRPVKQQETRMCPHCGNSMAKTRNFCPHCQNFRNGHSELIRPIQGQFHY